jgi:hypothetical protein
VCPSERSEIPPDPEESTRPSNPDVVGKDPLADGFRRSKRVAFQTSVDVYTGGENEEKVVEHAKTLNVSAHGALVVLSTPVESGRRLRLLNPKTKNEIECHVRRVVMAYAGGGAQVGLEFVAMSPDFWGIASPPADWDPAFDPAKQVQRLELPIEAPPEALPGSESKNPSADSRFDNFEEELAQHLVKSARTGTNAKKSKRSPRTRWLMLLAAAAMLFALWITLRKSSDAGPAGTEVPLVRGVAADDAAKIPNLENLRLAKEQDFDADAVSWIRNAGQHVDGKIPGRYSGSFESNAYIFVSKTNERRVIIFAGGELRYNAEYPVVAIAVRFPKELIQKTNWADSSPPESSGDGLLIVRAADSPASAVVLFVRADQIVTASPTDYRQIPFPQPH